MSEAILQQLLSGTYPDPDGSGTLAVTTAAVVIAESLAGRERELVDALDFGPHLAVVSDRITHQVLGVRIETALAGRGRISSIVLPERPHADADTVARIRVASQSADALIAVGSGTINDLCKYAAAEAHKPYAVFATAPSMNGYTSLNAAITIAGHKKSLPARAAAGVFMDLRVLSAAPARMIRSGLGDSLCRPTAQADWLLAHTLRGEPYRQAPFELLQQDEEILLTEPEGLLAGDVGAMRCLAQTLVLSGFGMSICGSSMPASQGEHLISHYLEMLGDPAWPESFHGEQIGVTTLTMARLQQRLLAGPAPILSASGPERADLLKRYGAELGQSCWNEFSRKRLTAETLPAVNARLADAWDALRERIARISRPVGQLEATLRCIGAPVKPEDLGWPSDRYADAVRHAREIRNRYTFLDLAADSGLLDDFI